MGKPAKRRDEAERAEALAQHWRQRAAEFRKLARGPEASQFRRAAEQAKAIAESFSRVEIGARRAVGSGRLG